MILRRQIIIAVLLAGSALFAVYRIASSLLRSHYAPYKDANSVICPTKQTCQDMKNNCKCWCSHKCGPRDKEADDSPVYVNDDKHGNFCYCKQWDLDNVGRCIVKPNANAEPAVKVKE